MPESEINLLKQSDMSRELLLDQYDIELRGKLSQKLGAEYIGLFGENPVAWANINEQFILIDKVGNYISSSFRDAIDFSEDYSVVKRIDGTWWYIGLSGEDIFPDEKFRYTTSFINGVALVVVENGKYRYIYKDGKNIFGREFQCAWSFINGVAKIKNEDGRNSIYRL